MYTYDEVEQSHGSKKAALEENKEQHAVQCGSSYLADEPDAEQENREKKPEDESDDYYEDESPDQSEQDYHESIRMLGARLLLTLVPCTPMPHHSPTTHLQHA